MVRFNEQKAAASRSGADKLPNLISEDKLNALLMDDKDPFYFSLTYPNRVEGTGGIYDGYHADVLRQMKERNEYLNGSKNGHDKKVQAGEKNQDRDVHFIGGEVGETTTTYKGYVPPVGTNGDNSALKRAINTGAIEFSVVADVAEKGDEQENGIPVYKRDLATHGLPPMDVVDKGAQNQTVNRNSDIEKQIMNLIAANAIDYTSHSTTPIYNGKVSKKFFVKNQSVAEYKGLSGKGVKCYCKKEQGK